MDGLSAAANVIAVIQLTGTVWSLCSDYLKEAKNAKNDIERLQSELAGLETVLKGAHNLLKDPNADKLLVSRKFSNELGNCSLQLHDVKVKLEKKPETRKRDKIIHSWAFRSLKWPFESKDIDNIVRNIFKFRETLSTSLNIDQTTLLLQNFALIDSEEQLKILDWISSEPYGKHHRTVKEARTEGTCEWLLQHEKFREWESSNSSAVLWLQGSPGAGKTFLASKVIDHVQSQLEMSPNQGFAFFYCNRNEPGRREPLSILKSYVRQLSTATSIFGRIRKGLKDLYQDMRAKGSDIGFDECRKQLHEAVSLYDNTTLVLDALDECETESRLRIIDIIDSLPFHSKKVNFFLSSRGDRDIRNKFSKTSNIEIQASNNGQDIQTFVESEISKHQNWKEMSSLLKQDIVGVLLKNSEEMFQWVYLQIKQILGLESEEAIRDRLGKLPSGLKATYDEIYGKIKDRNKHDKAFADRAFMWVMSAAQPLTSENLLSAIRWSFEGTLCQNSEITESQLLYLCNNLLVLDSQRNVWRFSHLSVAEYFENNYWTRQKAHCYIAKICLSYLIELYKDPEAENEHGGRGDWLKRYSKDCWIPHVQTQEEEKPDPVLCELLKTFLGSPKESSVQYQRWYRDVCYVRRRMGGGKIELPFKGYWREMSGETNIIWFMCHFSFYAILSDWWQSADIPLLETNGIGDNLLSFAAQRGHRPICEVLIKRGMDVNLQDEHYGSSLAAAATLRGNIEVVKYLIEQGADVNLALHPGTYENALSAAVFTTNLKIAKFLVKKGADISSIRRTKVDPFLRCRFSTHDFEIIRFLVGEGADINLLLQNVPYISAIFSAISEQDTNSVAFLLDQGANVNISLSVGFGIFEDIFYPEGRCDSMLATAVALGSTEVVNFLIERGADVDMKLLTGDCGSALAAAACWGRKSCAELLIKAGADVNLRLEHGIYRTAFEASQVTRAINIFELRKYRWGSQLQWEEGRAEVAELLRRAGATS